MRLSVSVTHYSWPVEPPALADRLAATVRVADEAGLDTVWVADHLMQGAPGTTPEQEMLGAYTTLSFLASETTRVRLGDGSRCRCGPGTTRRSRVRTTGSDAR